MGFLDGLTPRQVSVLLGVLGYLFLTVSTYHFPETVMAHFIDAAMIETLANVPVELDKDLKSSSKRDQFELYRYNTTPPTISGNNSHDKPAISQVEAVNPTLSQKITSESPLFVLGLPNSGDAAINRYFKCAGLNQDELGNFWTMQKRDKSFHEWVQIGKCIDDNLKARKSPLQGCGDFRVWTNAEYISKHRPVSHEKRKCFFPTLQRDSLHKMFEAHPNATILHVVQDPDHWYESLSIDMKQRWPKLCNQNHNNQFPEANATKSEWIHFYSQHRENLRESIKRYPTLKYIEVSLGAKARRTADLLQSKLDIPGSCWLESAMKPNRPTTVNYPILVAALPKSATSSTHDYLNCGVGNWQGAHQWTRTGSTNDLVTVGKCIQGNIKHKRPIFYDCGDNMHWSDIGDLDSKDCFYPTIEGGLEAMYETYPYGTIMNVVRDAHSWYRSASKWRNILHRWSQYCSQFPPKGSTEQDWVDFYHWHTHTVRQFAKRHPTMTYVEIKLESNTTSSVLEETFGFDTSCWGHANVNKK